MRCVVCRIRTRVRRADTDPRADRVSVAMVAARVNDALDRERR